MLTLFAIIAVAGVLFAASVLATKEGDELVDVSPDRADLNLPAGRLVAEDLRQVRFTMALRGYRMDEVDVVLDRLCGELAERDARIAELEMALAAIVEPVVSEAERQQAESVPEQPPVLEAPAPEPEPEPAPASVILTTAIVETPVILPSSPEPVVEKPVAQEPVAQEPVVPEPVAEEPVAPEPVAEEPMIEADTLVEPVPEPAAVPEPVVPEPEPADEEPVEEGSVEEEPVEEEPVEEEPAEEEPAAAEPPGSEVPADEPEPQEQPPVTGLTSLFPEAEFPEVAPAEPASEDLPEATEDVDRPDRPDRPV